MHPIRYGFGVAGGVGSVGSEGFGSGDCVCGTDGEASGYVGFCDGVVDSRAIGLTEDLVVDLPRFDVGIISEY